MGGKSLSSNLKKKVGQRLYDTAKTGDLSGIFIWDIVVFYHAM
jgi:hypothetical protein